MEGRPSQVLRRTMLGWQPCDRYQKSREGSYSGRRQGNLKELLCQPSLEFCLRRSPRYHTLSTVTDVLLLQVPSMRLLFVFGGQFPLPASPTPSPLGSIRWSQGSALSRPRRSTPKVCAPVACSTDFKCHYC